MSDHTSVIENILSSTGYGGDVYEAVAAYLSSNRSEEAVRLLLASLEQIHTDIVASEDIRIYHIMPNTETP